MDYDSLGASGARLRVVACHCPVLTNGAVQHLNGCAMTAQQWPSNVQIIGALPTVFPPGWVAGGTNLASAALCPDLLRYEQIGAADGWRGRLVRAFFFVLRLWPA